MICQKRMELEIIALSDTTSNTDKYYTFSHTKNPNLIHSPPIAMSQTDTDTNRHTDTDTRMHMA